MKSVLFSVIILLSLSFQSCKDNLSVPTPASRNYQQDAAVLNEFVDINKTTHEYYINSNKRNSVLSYITNVDVEELNSVNSLNLSIFKESINQHNAGYFARHGGREYRLPAHLEILRRGRHFRQTTFITSGDYPLRFPPHLRANC